MLPPARFALSLALAVLTLPLPTLGSLSFPNEMKKHLNLADIPPPAPGCRICHKDDKGGVMNVNKPFGRTMMDLGLKGASLPSLRGALDAVEAAASDSDTDGTSDITELREGTDPNVRVARPGEDPLPPLEEIPLPETGCAVSAPSKGDGAAVGGLLLALVSLARRRRRR